MRKSFFVAPDRPDPGRQPPSAVHRSKMPSLDEKSSVLPLK